MLGQTDPADIFANALTGLAFTAPDLAQMFAGFNIDDAASREALRQQILGVVEQMLSGQLGVDQLGILPEQLGPLLDFLGIAADSLDTFDESVKDATQSMLNVPRGLNLALHEFQTQAVGLGQGGAAGPQRFDFELPFIPTGKKIGDASPFTPRGGDGAAAPAVHFAGGMQIIIQQQPGENMEALARRVRREFEKANLARTGDPLRSG